MALLRDARGAAGPLHPRRESALPPDGAGHRRHPRQPDRGAGDGREQAPLQVAHLRPECSVHGRGGGPERGGHRVRRARYLQRVPVDHLPGRHRHRRARVDLRRRLRRPVHPVRAELGPGYFQGRALGHLWHLLDHVHVRDAAGHRRVAATRAGPARPPLRRNAPSGLKSTAEKEDGMTRRSIVALALSLGVGLALLARLAVAADTPGVTATEVKIGHTNPYSGNASAYGTIGKGIAAYFKKMNDEGGINGRKINFVTYDDGYSPPKTVEMVRRLIEQDEVAFLFNTLGTPANSAIHKYMNQKKVPHLFVATGATKWGDPEHFPWTMGWQPNYQTESRIYAKWLMQTKPNAKIGILYQNDDYGKDYVKGLHDGLGAKAKEMIVSELSYEVTDPTIDSQIVSLKGSGADVFFNVTTPKFAAQAIRKSSDIG